MSPQCVAAMGEAASLPITVKCRIGIDDQDAEESLDRFIDGVAAAGARTFIVHARKAWLKGLSPKENRDVPPLDYGRVSRLKARRPELEIVLNGGIDSLASATAHLGDVDGVMLGRAAYADPYLMAEVDRELFGANDTPPSRLDVLDRFVPYVQAQLAHGRAPQPDDAAYPRPVPRPAPCARLPAISRRECAFGRRRHRCVAGGAAHHCGRGAHRGRR